MFGRYFMFMPMHARKCRTKYLHAVHTHIAGIGIWIFRMNDWKRYKWSTVFRPTGDHRKFGNVGIVLNDDLLALSTAAFNLGHPAGKLPQLWKEL